MTSPMARWSLDVAALPEAFDNSRDPRHDRGGYQREARVAGSA